MQHFLTVWNLKNVKHLTVLTFFIQKQMKMTKDREDNTRFTLFELSSRTVAAENKPFLF